MRLSEQQKEARIAQIISRCALLLLVLALGYWFWPTPWRYSPDGLTRVSRFTDRMEVNMDGHWRSGSGFYEGHSIMYHYQAPRWQRWLTGDR